MRAMALCDPVYPNRATAMTGPAGHDLFRRGPALALQERLGLIEDNRPNSMRRAALFVLVGWAPLAVLTLLENPAGETAFLSDAAVHARSLVAAPLFMLADAPCASRLGRIAEHLRGFVKDGDRAHFDAAASSTRRLLARPGVEAVIVALSYASVLGLLLAVPSHDLPPWQGGSLAGLSLAGWWHALVSLPIVIVLILGWAWRLLLWSRFLWLVSRLDLRLVPAHPDHMAGLLFVGYSVRTFSGVALPLGVIAAGWVAKGILHDGQSPFAYNYFILCFTAAVVALFTGPLLVFSGHLLREWRRGVFLYGSLAGQLGNQFEKRWSVREGKIDESVLDTPDFSSATDLYQVVSNVYAMRLVAIDIKSVILLAASVLLPFAVVLLLSIPPDEVLTGVARLLL